MIDNRDDERQNRDHQRDRSPNVQEREHLDISLEE